MIELWVELSQENLPLAELEVDSALEAIGGRRSSDGVLPTVVLIEVERETDGAALAGRLALARRVLRKWPERTTGGIADRLRREIRTGDRASFRRLASPGSRPLDPAVGQWAEQVQSAGGGIDLESPTRRFRFAPDGAGGWQFGEDVADVDRRSFDRRRMPTLPYRRPVSLAPRLGRVAANLARLRSGDRVVDPFVGTGALAIECALLGARVTGIDTDAKMAKGALANFEHLGVVAESIVVADAEAVAPEGVYDAIVTDPPYGRASPTGGEDADRLTRRVVTHWAAAVRPGGRVVVIQPGGADALGAPWHRRAAIPDRVHRSLTREFRVYEREPGPL
ncbi:MAG TPA: RsmD family RNA methyltransferase [Thermoplasmata archaeon]|nr:RsmD family RNA methyltransferase [Thermoplasmata archaeon]